MNSVKKGKDLKSTWDAFIRDADEHAFYCIYSHYHDYFIFLGLKKHKCTDQIQDIINDLFLYVYENRNKLLNVRDHHNYLITAFIRKLFRKTPLGTSGCLMLPNIFEEGFYPSPEVEYIAQRTEDELKAKLKRFMNQLPAKQNRIIYQKFYLGMSYKEISERNRISEKTVYNTIYIAVNKLRNLWNKAVAHTVSVTLLYLSL